jgi:hypothetical protein
MKPVMRSETPNFISCSIIFGNAASLEVEKAIIIGCLSRRSRVLIAPPRTTLPAPMMMPQRTARPK